MIRTPGFWQTEGDAPLLTRNHGMLQDGDNELIFERVAKWPSLVGIEASPVITPKDPILKALQVMLEDKVYLRNLHSAQLLVAYVVQQ